MGRMGGKRVLVCAAAHGIGRACAELFAREGAEVLATDIDESGLQSLAHGNDRIQPIVLDGTDSEAVHRVINGLPTVDSLVHCVGYVHHGSVLQCDASQWRRSFQVNVDSFYFALQATLTSMLQAKAGSIVCISSVASSLKGLPNRAAYGATKAALLGLVKSVAVDYVTEGIRCNAVCPGTVISPSLRERIAEAGKTMGGADQAMAMFVSRQPMNRLGTPDEIAALCLYLASDESRFVTGQFFAIDGGMTL